MKTYFSIVILSILVISILTGCSMTSMMNLTPDEQNYLEQAKAFPLEYYIPKEEANDLWGRAQSFIAQYSSMKLQVVTDYVIQTYNPSSSEVAYGYYITKTPMGDNIQISVKCIYGNMFTGDNADTNAHILAYYIKTGNGFSPRLVAR